MKRLERQVAKFNAKHPVGTAVVYRSSPSALATRSRIASEAWLLSGHTPVVMLDNVRGCVALSHCVPFAEKPNA